MYVRFIVYLFLGVILMATKYKISPAFYTASEKIKTEYIQTEYLDIVVKVIEEIKKNEPKKYSKLLTPDLVMSIIYKESHGNPYAMRYEPAFNKWLLNQLTTENFKYHSGAISRETEIKARSTSYGLMQVMGQTARETGYEGTFLSELCEPEVGIYWGTLYLSKLLTKYGNIEEAVAAYNAGSPRRGQGGNFVNQAYVDAVLAKAPTFIKQT